jgi:K+-sensing histidine kinase KdpD
MPRGQHKIFLGMAVGVGKTFRMLQEAQFVSADGRDVVIGLLETHGRADTAAMATGLELIPRRGVDVHGIDELRRLAAVFGAHMIVEADRSIARAVARVAAARGTTFIIMGTPHLHQRLGRPASTLVDEIVADDPSLDVVLVGDQKPNPSGAH